MSQLMGAKMPGMPGMPPFMGGKMPMGLPGGKGGFAQTGASSMMNPAGGAGLAQTGSQKPVGP